MGQKKLDRRVRRTRRLLADALVQLIKERGYTPISIADITDRAELNRATFYLHYSNKDELLIDLLESHFDPLVEEINQLEASADLQPWQSYDAERLVFEHVAENAELYKVLLGPNAVGFVILRVISYTAAVIENEFHKAGVAEMGSIPIPLIAQHVAGTLFAQVYWWLANDMPYPPEYMARLTYEMCMFGSMPVVEQQQSDLLPLTMLPR